MAGSPRGASCLPCTAGDFEGCRVEGGGGGWVVGGIGCGGAPEVRARPVALATALKNASSALAVMVGLCSDCWFLLCSARRGTSGPSETGPIRTLGAPAQLSSLLLSFILLFHLPPVSPSQPGEDVGQMKWSLGENHSWDLILWSFSFMQILRLVLSCCCNRGSFI